MIRLTAIGWKASTALAATGGVARVLAPLTASTYLHAAGEILWLGRLNGVRHPRAMLAAAEPPIPSGGVLMLDWAGLDPWRPRRAPLGDCARLRSGALDLLDALRGPDPGARPAGLGALLVGDPLPFPLDRAAGTARAMAGACERGDAAAAARTGEALLGLGPGLTPSGDDFVGGVLFARRLVAPEDRVWAAAAADLVERAHLRTHPISAALLADLAHAEGHEPLHDLIDALADGGAPDRVRRAVDRLAALGHSSGWDILTGVLVGLAGSAALVDLGDHRAQIEQGVRIRVAQGHGQDGQRIAQPQGPHLDPRTRLHPAQGDPIGRVRETPCRFGPDAT